jgi:hypothetical protein
LGSGPEPVYTFFLTSFDLKWIFVRDRTCGKETHRELNEMKDKSFEFPWRVLKESPLPGAKWGLMNTFLTLCHHHNEIPQKMPAIDEPFTHFPLLFSASFFFLIPGLFPTYGH